MSASTIGERALRAAGKVDRELRKTSLNVAERNLTIGKIERELEMPDGRRMSKVVTAFGRYCAYKESNGLVGGRDVFRDGVKTKIGPCP